LGGGKRKGKAAKKEGGGDKVFGLISADVGNKKEKIWGLENRGRGIK